MTEREETWTAPRARGWIWTARSPRFGSGSRCRRACSTSTETPLGALPKTAAADIDRVVREEWGRGLVESWLDADWFFLPRKAGDAIAPLIGASAGEVIVADSTSVNLFKLAVSLLRNGKGRRRIVTERGNFPTDVYILEGLVDLFDERFELVLAEPETIVRIDRR